MPAPLTLAPAFAPGVLVVDDDPWVLTVVRLGLERHGFRVWAAADGTEALDLYRRHAAEVAIVLLDVLMPGLDGPQTLDALQLLNADVAACFMSGEPGHYGPHELLARGAKAFFAKPFHLAELAGAIGALARDPCPGTVTAPTA